MEGSRERTQSVVGQASQVGDVRARNIQAVVAIDQMSSWVSQAPRQQSTVAREIDVNIPSINHVASPPAAGGAARTAHQSEGLARLANHLQGLVKQFRV